MKNKGPSFLNFISSEFDRGYLLENDEERFSSRRKKIETFIRAPVELEKFLSYGFFHCADSFLFVLTFLPLRLLFAIWSILQFPLRLFKRKRDQPSRRYTAQTIDLLKGTIIVICYYLISQMDTAALYHYIKTQSTIKLYIMFNMLEIADRLSSAFSNDILDTMFLSATENSKNYLKLILHYVLANLIIFAQTTIVLLQALSLSVAINSETKGLLSILISNNFIEIKGSVFKKFDRNNLLHITCSDARERFHLLVLMFIVLMLTMKEYSWQEDKFFSLLYGPCVIIWFTEFFIDYLKHAFITRFNDIPAAAYRDYTLLIAKELITCNQKKAFSDQSDLVARRMSFIPIPLGIIVIRILVLTLRFNNILSYFLLFVGYLCLFSLKILIGIYILGHGCNIIKKAEIEYEEETRCSTHLVKNKLPIDKVFNVNTRIPDIARSNSNLSSNNVVTSDIRNSSVESLIISEENKSINKNSKNEEVICDKIEDPESCLVNDDKSHNNELITESAKIENDVENKDILSEPVHSSARDLFEDDGNIAKVLPILRKGVLIANNT